MTSTSGSSRAASTPRSTCAATGSRCAASPGEVALAERLLDELVTIIRTGQGITSETVERAIEMLRAETTEKPADVLSLNILSNRGRSIRPKTLNQKRYVDAIDKHTITFGIGPAGTGKTYLAMAKAVQALHRQEGQPDHPDPAGGRGRGALGYLPGTLSEKIDPYLRPLYDALHDMIDPETIPKLLAAGTIEVAPLAFMRGRSLNDSFIILDEAQNTTPEQMKMFLTRLGFGSKIVVTGDITQVDLPGGTKSGLRVIEGILDDVEDISFNRLTSHDVVRHRLVGKIVAAYDEFDARGEPRRRSSAAHRTAEAPVTIEIIDESGHDVDVKHLAALSRFVMDQMRVHPLAELCIKAVDEDTIAQLNEQWMEKEGPTDVLAFPMDELRPGLVNEEPEEGVLGDLVLCPAIAVAQGETAGHGTARRDRAAHDPRHPAPARLRPRRAGGAPRDVRAAGPAPGAVAQPMTSGQRGPAARRRRPGRARRAASPQPTPRSRRSRAPAPPSSSRRSRAGAKRLVALLDDAPRHLNTALLLRAAVRDLRDRPRHPPGHRHLSTGPAGPPALVTIGGDAGRCRSWSSASPRAPWAASTPRRSR